MTWRAPQRLAEPDMWRDIPVEPDADTAREWAREELAKSEYQGGGTNWVQRFFDWIERLINGLGNATGGTFGGWGVLAAIVVGLALVGLVVWIVVGPLRRARRRAVVSDELGDPTLRASELHASARAAAQAGDYSAAVLHGYRSLVRALDERGVIEARVGMTAYEAAVTAGAALPAVQGSLAVDADTFDAVRYGHLVATRGHYEHLLDTRERALRAKVVVESSEASP